MANPFGAPEATVEELDEARRRGDPLVLLDVREASELGLARLPDGFFHVPLSELSERGAGALPDEANDRDAPLIIMCHLGVRSAQVTTWLIANGWTNVRSLAGGIEAYAIQIDPRVGRY